MVTVSWNGAPSSGVNALPAGADPMAWVTITNTTSSPLTFGADFFVLSNDPGGKRNPGKPLPYASFSTGVWDWRTAHGGKFSLISVQPGATTPVTYTWPRTHQDGTSAAAGRYFLLVPYTVNGAPAGYAEATFDLH
jgi:hypothetical protein